MESFSQAQKYLNKIGRFIYVTCAH